MNLKTFAAALMLGASSTAVMAADLPSRKVAPAPVYVAPVFTWTGFYVGLQAGGVWDKVSIANNNQFLFATPVFPGLATGAWWLNNTGATTRSGFVGGGHIGYNWQINSFLLGAEGDLEGASVYGGSLRASLRGRLGFALDRALIYATGGVAFAERSGNNTNGLWGWNWGGNTSSSQVGWTVGGGVEYAFTPNWSAGLEYRYTDYGTNNNNNNWGWLLGNVGSNLRVTENAVRARISYHFHSAPVVPVVAKY